MLPRGGVVAEIGVQRGDYADEILRRARPRRLYLIDCWQHQCGTYALDKSNVSAEEHEAFYRRVLGRFGSEIRSGRVTVIRGFSHEVLPTLTVGSFDWVYLDGDHSLEAVRRDLRDCARIVRRRGFICGHDYCRDERAGFGVAQAVEEFCRDCGWELIMLTDRDPLCDGVYESFVLGRRGEATAAARVGD
jgi:hypothetical protein